MGGREISINSPGPSNPNAALRHVSVGFRSLFSQILTHNLFISNFIHGLWDYPWLLAVHSRRPRSIQKKTY